MALVRPPPHDPSSPSAKQISTDNAEELMLLETPEKERPHQLPPPHSGIMLKSARLVLVLILALSYLTFCFIVHYRNVPVGGSEVLGPPSLHFRTESGITTIAILVVYIVLWPINCVIGEIRAEEFFRLLRTHPNGVPLDSVNTLSSPTAGAFDIFLATIHRHCSPLLTSTLVISLVITATSLLAPAALNARSIWIDVDDPTFQIGAIPNGSFYVDLGSQYRINPKVSMLLPVASTMSWVENTLNLTNGYYMIASSEADPFEYLVPFPPGYTNAMKAQWTTDIIVVDPSCSWQTATMGIDLTGTAWSVELPQSNLGTNLFNDSDSFVSSPMLTTKVSVTQWVNISATEFKTPMDGSTVFTIAQLDHPVMAPTDSIYKNGEQIPPTVNLSSIPNLQFPNGNVLAFLLCSPNASIQTRQVWATGNGNLTLGQPRRSPGNIDSYQANYILSGILSAFQNNSGPNTLERVGLGDVGTDMMATLIFGDNFKAFLNSPPAPLTNITAAYTRVIRSAMKTLLSGTIATANVTGGYAKEQMVFTSSLGYVITSTILFTLLAITLVAAKFRKGRDAFTFVDVAAALANSDVPQKCAEMTQFKAGREEMRVLKLVPSGDGGLNCTYQSVGC